jgi:(2R)-sulfolactate sulfo-lyase subunit alpha
LPAPDFIVHDAIDNVGVVVVEDVKKGKTLTGWVMEGNKTIKVTALKDIPLGHKVALSDLKNDDTIIKYGHDIGRMTKAAKRGDHVHVHNLKTKRW